jgi:hypothetical protein
MAGDRSTRTTKAAHATSVDTREFCVTPAEPGRVWPRSASTRAAARQPLGGQPTSPETGPESCAGECALGTQPAVKRLKPKFAECQKAIVGGIGAITAAVVPLSPFLPGSIAHLIAAAVALMTGFATYLTKNATQAAAVEPMAQAVPESPPQIVLDQLPASAPARHTAPVLAGLALIVGGAVLAGRHTERHSRCVTPFTLLPPGSIASGR